MTIPGAVNALLGAGVAAAGPFRYLRINVTANDGGATLDISELNWLVGAASNPDQNMTSDTAPSPFVASASTAEGSSPAYKAFDGTNTQWETTAGNTTGWVVIDLGAGNEINPTSMTVKATSSGTTRAPKDFTLEGSNTGAFAGEETILKTVTGETAWGASEERTFNIP